MDYYLRKITMLKPVLLSGFVGLSIVSFAIAAQAQSQGQIYQAQVQSAASPTIPALELQQFVQVQKRWKGIEQQSQGLMVQAIKSEGLTPERFMAILKQKQSPTPSDEPLSTDDNTKFEKIIAKFQKIEEESIPKKEKAIISQGLDIQRFGQIQRTIQQDPALQEKVKKMLGEDVQQPAKQP